MDLDPREFLLDLFGAAVGAADPLKCLPQYLPPLPKGRTLVVGAGKAAASMAKAVEDNWQGPLEGLVITRYEHGLPLKKIRVVEAGHPVPDQEGADAANEILRMLGGVGPDDLVLCLISGGGSSLLAKPGGDITLAEKKAVTQALLASGADITEMNTLRKHLSAIKGGRLALAAYPAKVVTLAISDVPGDDIAVIASGPTVPDHTSTADALAVLKKYDIEVPPSVTAYLRSPDSETADRSHPAFENCRHEMISTPQASLEAAAALCRDRGLTPLILSDRIEGEAREVARDMAEMANRVKTRDEPVAKPCVLISGGETTVTVANSTRPGRGGRNCEFLLSLAIHLNALTDVHALACDTDGIDGTEDNAGAIISPDTLERSGEMGISAADFLARHDSYTYFDRLGDLVKTGPTRTNVNDFRAILIR